MTDPGAAAEAAEGRGRAARITPLHVLVVGTDDWAVTQSVESLRAGGATALTCHEPGDPPFPCNALRKGGVCPLDIGVDVVVTVRARPVAAPSEGEFGVICALRAGAPLVSVGMTANSPFEPWVSRAVGRDGDVAQICEEVVTECGHPIIDLAERPAR